MAFNSFKKLLFGFAFSPSLKANVFEVTRLASFLEASLVFVHVGEKTTEKETLFNAILEECPDKPKNVELHWKTGNPVETLIKICQTIHLVNLYIMLQKKLDMKF